MRRKNLPKALLKFSGTFEFELLITLMLYHWKHPNANDSDYRSALIECTAEVLASAATGEKHVAELPPQDMNVVAAAWYAESVTAEQNDPDESIDVQQARRAWLSSVRHSLPSCFCDATNLL